VHVLTVKTDKTRSSEGERLVDYLLWHGIAADCRVLGLTDAVGSLLLGNADRLGADLLVMGGYVQNRLTELLLGGVTAYVFSHAKLPILLAR
jgi:nucleotide-binding universal stress UspA family protein